MTSPDVGSFPHNTYIAPPDELRTLPPAQLAVASQSEFSFAVAPETSAEYVAGLEIAMSSDSRHIDFDVNPETGEPVATGYTDVTINGLWHKSTGEISKFVDDKQTMGAHGVGTYLGGGAVGGDRVGDLTQNEHYDHAVTLTGNVLFVPLTEADDASWNVIDHVEAAGEAVDDATTRGAPGVRLNKILRAHAIDGMVYDAFVLHGRVQPGDSSSDYRAEAVVLNPAKALAVNSVEYVNPQG